MRCKYISKIISNIKITYSKKELYSTWLPLIINVCPKQLFKISSSQGWKIIINDFLIYIRDV